MLNDVNESKARNIHLLNSDSHLHKIWLEISERKKQNKIIFGIPE